MKKLIYKVIFLFCLILISFTFMVSIFMQDKNNYIFALGDKNIMLQRKNTSRIILIGGSNLAFGVDSEKISQRTGRSVINMGLQAGMGLKFMLNDVKPFIHKDDIIVIVPEYEHFYDNAVNGGAMTFEALLNASDQIKYLDSKQIYSMIASTPNILSDCFKSLLSFIINRQKDAIYRRDGFNTYGDLITHLDKKGEKISGSIINPSSKYNEDTIKCLIEFSRFASKRQAHVYYDFPPIPLNQFSKEKIDFVQSELNKKLNFQIIGNSEEYVFPTKYFFNTVYHLNSIGREIRTNKLVNDMEKIRELSFN